MDDLSNSPAFLQGDIASNKSGYIAGKSTGVGSNLGFVRGSLNTSNSQSAFMPGLPSIPQKSDRAAHDVNNFPERHSTDLETNRPLYHMPGPGLYVGQMAVWGGSRWELYTPIKNNYVATTSPSTSDDSGDGYSVGSWWINVTADTAHVCVDATVGAAVWLQIG